MSSVGFVRGKKILPRVVDCCNHVRYFRHALALDERRVKFLPEYVHEGLSHRPDESPFQGQEGPERCSADIKEVWFAGTHSDVYVCSLATSTIVVLLIYIAFTQRRGKSRE